MTHPTDLLLQPQPERSTLEGGMSLQESGNDGFSSKLQHQFNDKYSDRALSEATHGSFLESAKGERHISVHLESKKKVWSYPAVFASPEARLTSAEEVFLKPSTVAEVQKNNFPPQAAPISGSKSNLQGETDEPLAQTTAITEEQPDVEAGGEVRSTKMDTRRKPVKPKFQPLVRQKGKGGKKAVQVLCWIVLFVPVSKGSPVGAQAAADQGYKYFTCTDKERCPTLMTIYDRADCPVYQRALGQTIPACLGLSLSPSEKCAVCRDQDICIMCSNDTSPVEMEGINGTSLQFVHTTSSCIPQEHTRPHHYCLIPLAVLIGLAVLVGVIACCRKNRTENSREDLHDQEEDNRVA